MDTLATRFRAVLFVLRDAVIAHTWRSHARAPIFTLLILRLERIANRFDALFARWQAGTLPQPRKPRPARLATPRERPCLPRRRAWLLHEPEIFRLCAVTARGRLEALMATADFDNFVQQVPRAGRLLRPLCHMLGITAAPGVPAALNLPPTPKFRPQPPPPPPYLGILDPPEVRPRWPGGAQDRSGRAWYQ